jgi:hypothetical protein
LKSQQSKNFKLKECDSKALVKFRSRSNTNEYVDDEKFKNCLSSQKEELIDSLGENEHDSLEMENEIEDCEVDEDDEGNVFTNDDELENTVVYYDSSKKETSNSLKNLDFEVKVEEELVEKKVIEVDNEIKEKEPEVKLPEIEIPTNVEIICSRIEEPSIDQNSVFDKFIKSFSAQTDNEPNDEAKTVEKQNRELHNIVEMLKSNSSKTKQSLDDSITMMISPEPKALPDIYTFENLETSNLKKKIS